MGRKEDRDARVQALSDAVTKYVDARKKRLQKQLETNKTILRGRGSERLAQASVDAATDLVVDELDDFLTGNP